MIAEPISAGQVAILVKSGMWQDYGVSLCQPDVFDRALGAPRHIGELGVIQQSAGHINFRLAPLKRLTLLAYPIGGTLA